MVSGFEVWASGVHGCRSLLGDECRVLGFLLFRLRVTYLDNKKAWQESASVGREVFVYRRYVL